MSITYRNTCREVTFYISFSAPQLFRDDIDSYNVGTEIPTFQIAFRWKGDGPPKTLHHKIFMSGVEPTGSFFSVVIRPGRMGVSHAGAQHYFATATVLTVLAACTASSEFA